MSRRNRRASGLMRVLVAIALILRFALNLDFALGPRPVVPEPADRLDDGRNGPGGNEIDDHLIDVRAKAALLLLLGRRPLNTHAFLLKELRQSAGPGRLATISDSPSYIHGPQSPSQGATFTRAAGEDQ